MGSTQGTEEAGGSACQATFPSSIREPGQLGRSQATGDLLMWHPPTRRVRRRIKGTAGLSALTSVSGKVTEQIIFSVITQHACHILLQSSFWKVEQAQSSSCSSQVKLPDLPAIIPWGCFGIISFFLNAGDQIYHNFPGTDKIVPNHACDM